MKTLRHYFLIGILISVFVTTSCRKEDDEPLMTAKVNGSSWTALVRNVTLSQSQNIFVISGFPTLSQTASQSIVITVRGSAAGTYSLSAFVDEMSGQCMLVYKTSDNASAGSATYYNSYSATVVLTEVDTDEKRISGTFQADMYPNGNPAETKIPITEGKFENLSYSVIN
jgi:hypothetical protein